MAVTKILILQGMSGTGKTSLAYAFGEFLDNKSTVVPVQPMWKERTDLVGYYNEFTKRFNETTLLQKMYEANYSKDIYVTILDEMNIARVEYYFAEFLSLLELPNPDRRYLDVVSDEWSNDPVQLKGGQIKLPNNMWFIGTANNDDSTFAISDKVYDRAMVMNLDQKSEPFTAPKTRTVHITAERFMRLAEEATKEYTITNRNMKRLEKLDEYMVEVFHITFGNRIMKQIKTYIPVYVACGGEELDALDDILSKKVLRKLETQNPVYIRSVVDGFCEYLDELFGEGKMPLCKEYVQRLKKNA
jgi:5-methylcytosine-specific restriction endonuclease McrBC GTP-binding regulatory subunit McrB